MKKLSFCLVLVAICATLFSGCKKDDSDDPASRVAGAKISKVTEYVNGKVYSTDTYQYDGSGRLSKATYNTGQSTTFEYIGSSVVVKDYSKDGSTDDNYGVFNLNSKGLATSVSNVQAGSTEKKAKIDTKLGRNGLFASVASDDVDCTYEYDNDGYQIRELWSDNQDKNYVIANGNVVSSYGTWEWGYEETYELLKDKKNTIGYENMGIFFMGRQDANLRSSVTSKNKDEYGKWHTYKDSYTYEYDSKNRVIKKTEISEGEQTSNRYTTYTYID